MPLPMKEKVLRIQQANIVAAENCERRIVAAKEEHTTVMIFSRTFCPEMRKNLRWQMLGVGESKKENCQRKTRKTIITTM